MTKNQQILVIGVTILSVSLMLWGILLTKYRMLKKQISNKSGYLTKENKLITEILDLAFQENNPLQAIINKLREYYNIDYCTIFESANEKLYTIGSNVNRNYQKQLQEYCSNKYNELNGKQALLETSKTCLDYGTARERGIKYSYFIKLDNNVGAILIENKSSERIKEFELEIFSMVVKNITIVIQNLLYQHRMQTLAMRDNLTKAFNRNYMQMQMQKLIDKDEVFSVAMFDIDNFKKFNDQYGHDAGDIVLKETSRLINDILGPDDNLYRWGGEEFIITFDNQDIQKSIKKLEKIRSLIDKNIIQYKDIHLHVTCSFGLVGYRSGYDIDTIIKAADQALYTSKENGKNKCTIYNYQEENCI